MEQQTKRKQGRPRIEEFIPPDVIVQTYKDCSNMEAGAKTLGISIRSFRRYVAALMTSEDRIYKRFLRTPKENRPWEAVIKSPIHTWMQRHPDTLIRSPTDLAEITGVPLNTVKSYLQRRRRSVERLCHTFGNLPDCGKKVVDVRGRTLTCRFITDYNLWVDPFTYQVTIRGMLGTAGYFTARLGLLSYAELFGKTVDPNSFFGGPK